MANIPMRNNEKQKFPKLWRQLKTIQTSLKYTISMRRIAVKNLRSPLNLKSLASKVFFGLTQMCARLGQKSQFSAHGARGLSFCSNAKMLTNSSHNQGSKFGHLLTEIYSCRVEKMADAMNLRPNSFLNACGLN